MGFSLTCKYCPDTGDCPVLASIWRERVANRAVSRKCRWSEYQALTAWGQRASLVITGVTYASILISLCFPLCACNFHRQTCWGGELKLSSCTVNFFVCHHFYRCLGQLWQRCTRQSGCENTRKQGGETSLFVSVWGERKSREECAGKMEKKSMGTELMGGRKVMCSYLD